MPKLFSWKVSGAVLTIALAAVAALPAPAHAGAWVADAKSGCQVWNPNPQLGETVKWSGACANDRAEGPGIVQWWRGELAYETDEGDWHDGRQINAGKQSWTGGRYDGELVDGEPSGHGVLIVQKLRYEGEFQNGKPNGQGTLTAGNETVHGTWKDGCLQGPRKASIGVPLTACR